MRAPSGKAVGGEADVVIGVDMPALRQCLLIVDRAYMADDPLTVGRLAAAAGVGVETVRYYQQRKLLPVPAARGVFRYYDASLKNRIHFIKRAQELGFLLDEVRELLRLQDGANRRAIRRISTARLAQIKTKLADLHRMLRVLKHLVIAALARASPSSPCVGS